MKIPIKMQADDFLNAYHVLQNVAPVPSAPVVVNLSFALELYFKDVYCALDKKPPKEHKVIKLFEGLPEPIRQEIFLHKAISQNPFHTRGDLFSPKSFSHEYTPYERFCDQIKAISEAFMEWRYPHDQERAALKYDSSLALALIEALKAISDKIRSQPAA